MALRRPVAHQVGEARLLRSGKVLREGPYGTSPLGEALPLSDLLIEVLQWRGGFPFRGTEDYLSRMLKGVSSKEGVLRLKREGIITFFRSSPPPQRVNPPLEEISFRGSGEGDRLYPLVIFTSLSDGLLNAKWIAEIAHDNPLWINPETAKGMGLKDGERVTLASRAGGLKVRVRLTERVAPGVLALAERALRPSRIARGEKFRSPDPDTQLLWWRAEEVNPYRLLEGEYDPLGGGPALAGTRVRIERIEG